MESTKEKPFVTDAIETLILDRSNGGSNLSREDAEKKIAAYAKANPRSFKK